MTGKPIIYLTYNDNIDYTDQMRKVLSSCYIVNNETELLEVIEQLKNGNDMLAERRKEVFEQEFSGSINVSEKMKQIFVEEYKN